MGDSGNGAPGFQGARERYLELLQYVLNDLDENGLTDLPLLEKFDTAENELRNCSNEFYGDRKLVTLVFDVYSFLGLAIRTMSQTGGDKPNLRQRINELLSELTDNTYQPIYQPPTDDDLTEGPTH